MHATTWHQYPALPRTNEMVTREILSWFVVGSLCTPVYPSPPKFQFNLENVSNQWWAPGRGLLKIQSL